MNHVSRTPEHPAAALSTAPSSGEVRADPDPLLSVRDLRVSIAVRESGEVREILRGVGFDVAAGEALALVGESGSGKSMTARSIMRLLPEGATATGEVRFRGESVLSMDKRRLRSYRASDVSMIFQDPKIQLDPTHTIGHFLVETLQVCRPRPVAEARKRAISLLDDVRIHDAARRMSQYPHELSGGMLQRVMIAGALASEPALLLADEPTTALDVTVQAEVVRILSELRQQHQLAMLFITHNLELAEVACDRLAVMYAGQVVELHDDMQIEAYAAHPYTIGLVQARPHLEQRLAELPQLPGRPLSASEAPPGCAFASRCELAVDLCRADPGPELRRVGRSLVACHRAGEARALAADVLRRPAEVAVPPASHDPVVVVDGVSRVFASGWMGGRSTFTAVDDVSFAVERGDSLAVVGESGSGKTTLARMLVGLDTPTSGQIRIDGEIRRGRRIGALNRADSARKIQIVFQDPYASLDPRQRIGATLREALRRGKDSGARSEQARLSELMDLVGLSESLADRFPRRLSGGQRQRVAIARALAIGPEVLVLDEPVASLDVSIQAQILNVLAKLRRELGVTYIFITHDLAVVRQVADRVIVMQGGTVVEEGPSAQVLEAPQTDYTRKLIASAPARIAEAAV